MMLRCVLVLLMAMLFVAGCSSPSRSTDVQFSTVGAEQRDDAWARIYQKQQKRRTGLELFSSSGEFTLRSIDTDSSTWDQVDLRLWWRLPEQMAIRLSTLGTRLALAGWNGNDWWIFDETGDDVLLTVFDSASGARARSELELVSPPLLMALAGIIDFPDESPSDLEVSSEGAYRFSIPAGISGRGVGEEIQRFVFTLGSLGPTSVRCDDSVGNVVMSSKLSRFKPVECRGLPKGAWPDMPFKIVVDVPTDNSGKTEITITLDQPLAGKPVPERMFNLDALREVIGPENVTDWRNLR